MKSQSRNFYVRVIVIEMTFEKNKELINEYLAAMENHCRNYNVPELVLLANKTNNIKLEDIYTELDIVSQTEIDEKQLEKELVRKLSVQEQNKIMPNIYNRFFYEKLDIYKKRKELKTTEIETKEIFVEAYRMVEKEEKPKYVLEEDGQEPYEYRTYVFFCRVKNGDSASKIRKIFVLINEDCIKQIEINQWNKITGFCVKDEQSETLFVKPNDEETNEKIEHVIDSLLNIINQEGNDDNGIIIRASSGGGKTTYLKKVVLDQVKRIKNDETVHANQIPVWISAREIRTKDIDDKTGLKSIIIRGIYKVLKKEEPKSNDGKEYFMPYIMEKSVKIYKDFFESKNKILLVIDDFDELSKEKGDKLLELIKKSYLTERDICGRIIISTIDTEYSSSSLRVFSKENSISEYKIEGIRNNRRKILEISEKVYRAIGTQNTVEDFKRIYDKNIELRRLINTPMELIYIITLGKLHVEIPYNISLLYKKIIERWLEYTEENSALEVFSNEDIIEDAFMELSRVALFMANSKEERNTISANSLKYVIEKTRNDLKTRYRNNNYLNEEIDTTINFLKETNIIEIVNGEYVFKNKQYQAFLSAFCIVENFIAREDDIVVRSNKQLDKMVYLNNVFEKKDDYWNRIIVFIALMDESLCEKISDRLLLKAQQEKEEKTYLNSLLTIAATQGIEINSTKISELYDEAFYNKESWEYFTERDKKIRLQQLLSKNCCSLNCLFVKKAQNKYLKLLKNNNQEAEMFRKRFFDIFYYVFFRCEIQYDGLEDIAKTLLKDYITMWSLSMTYEEMIDKFNRRSLEEPVLLVRDNEDAIKFIHKCNKELIIEGKGHSIIIDALIKGYESFNRKPLEATIFFYNIAYGFETEMAVGDDAIYYKSVAGELVCIAAWLFKHQENDKYDFEFTESSIETIIPKIKSFIIMGLDDNNKYIQENCMKGFVEWSFLERLLKPKEVIKEQWNSKPTFENCARLKNTSSLCDLKTLTPKYRILASYPLLQGRKFGKNLWTEEEKKYFVRIFNHGKTFMDRVYAFKLLIMTGVTSDKNIEKQISQIELLISHNEIDNSSIAYWELLNVEIKSSFMALFYKKNT